MGNQPASNCSVENDTISDDEQDKDSVGLAERITDAVPLYSQGKSLFQTIIGDTHGARQTQARFVSTYTLGGCDINKKALPARSLKPKSRKLTPPAYVKPRTVAQEAALEAQLKLQCNASLEAKRSIQQEAVQTALRQEQERAAKQARLAEEEARLAEEKVARNAARFETFSAAGLTERQKLFGTSLADAVRSSDPSGRVPSPIREACGFLRGHLGTEGLFRVPGSNIKASARIKAFEQCPWIEWPEAADDPSIACTLIVKWLMTLRDDSGHRGGKLWGGQLEQQLADRYVHDNAQTTDPSGLSWRTTAPAEVDLALVELIRGILSQTPVENQATLQDICSLLHEIVTWEHEHPNSNKMDAKKLLLCLQWPACMAPLVDWYPAVFDGDGIATRQTLRLREGADAEGATDGIVLCVGSTQGLQLYAAASQGPDSTTAKNKWLKSQAWFRHKPQFK